MVDQIQTTFEFVNFEYEFIKDLVSFIKFIFEISKKIIIIDSEIKKNRENLFLAPFFNKAERIAIVKSSLPDSILT